MRRLSVLLVALIACGGGAPSGPLAETAARLRDIRSATIHISFTSEGASGPVGFMLDGPIELREGSLPVARLNYTRIDGQQTHRALFVSDGEQASIEVGGETIPIADEALGPLKTSQGEGRLRVERWLKDPTESTGPDVEGDATDRVVATMDPVAVVEDLGAFARAFTDGTGGSLDERNAAIVRRAVKSSRFDLITGARDRFLRSVTIVMRFEPPGLGALERALGDLAGLTVRFEVSLERVNEPVPVTS